MTIMYYLIMKKVELSRLETKMLRHMSFLMELLALGILHLAIALLCVVLLFLIVLLALGMKHLVIALL